MMKRHLVLIVLLALAVAPATTWADPVNVDFASLGATSASITLPDTFTLSGVRFSFDPQGSGAFGGIDATGINVFGIPGGNLIFDFNFIDPAVGLWFNFSALDIPAPPDGGYDLLVSLSLGGIGVADITVPAVFDPTQGIASGQFAFTGPAFDSAQMSVDLPAAVFNVNPVSYLPQSAVPEPTAVVGLLSMGAVGLVMAWRKRRQPV